MRLGPALLIGAVVAFLAFIVFVPRWHAPVPGRQLGFAAASMVQFAPDPWQKARQEVAVPVLPPLPADRRPARAAYRNVQALGDMNAGDFMRLQLAMTLWVSPQQGCGFCHVAGDYASDAKPTKAAARQMLAMTRHINTAWSTHVGAGGVTCFSCHQGQPVPQDVWFPAPPQPAAPMMDRPEDWDESARTVHRFFPKEGEEEYLVQASSAISQSRTAYPTGQTSDSVVVKRVYEWMMQMADGMGVNCGFCHNSRALADWSQSTPMRWVGLGGIRMTRDINRNYLLGVAQTVPESRLPLDVHQTFSAPRREQGWQVGNGLADCSTCHHGAPIPTVGAGLARQFPTLWGGNAPPAPNATPAAAIVPNTPG